MEEAYYVVARLALLTTLLFLTMHGSSMLYLRWALGREEVRDGVPFQLCALAQSVACGQLLLVMLRSLGLGESFLLGGVWHTVQSAASACLFALTPFAYLFHEAVGVGYVWGAAGFAGRAAEAAVLLGLIAILGRGFASVLASLLDEPPLAGAGLGGAAAGAGGA